MTKKSNIYLDVWVVVSIKEYVDINSPTSLSRIFDRTSYFTLRENSHNDDQNEQTSEPANREFTPVKPTRGEKKTTYQQNKRNNT